MGCVCLAAVLYFVPLMFQLTELNELEVAQVSSIFAWIFSMTVLLSYTCAGDKTTAEAGFPTSDSPLDNPTELLDFSTGEDVRTQLFNRLIDLDYEQVIGDVKLAKRDDVMTYLTPRMEFRTPILLSTLLMVAGIVLLVTSLKSVD